MRYYVTARINDRLCVVGEVVADINPAEDQHWIWPDGLARELVAYEVETLEIHTDEELSCDRESARALSAWRGGDDSVWGKERLAINRAEVERFTRRGLAAMAEHGHVDAALLLREGSLAQQCEYIERDTRRP